MLFNSLDFVFFFPAVVAIYFALPYRYRWMLLLGASYLFYGLWEWSYLGLIWFSTTVDYFAARAMGERKTKKARRPFLWASLAGNLGLLFFFKYFDWASMNVGGLADMLGWDINTPVFNLLLPVGISFYTFQTLAYTIDVYRGKVDAEKHFGIFALYVTFFPQLVAGPIERSGNLLPQFFRKHDFSYNRTVSGLRLMAWGFFKKLVIADRVSLYVNIVFADIGSASSAQIIVAGGFFAYQVYCDFSGYCDIAIGAARIMGYDLSQNFNRPYFATSTAELWRRWHMTLVDWFRDYVYYPLGGSRGRAKAFRNVMIVFFLTGVWHGASWTFAIWGMLNGLIIIASVSTKKFRDNNWRMIEKAVAGHTAPIRKRRAGSKPRPVPTPAPIAARGFTLRPSLNMVRQFRYVTSVIGTFGLFYITGTWFRAQSVADGWQVYVTWAKTPWEGFGAWMVEGFTPAMMVISLSMIMLLEAVHVVQERGHSVAGLLARMPRALRWTFYWGLIFIILFFGVFDNEQFIYFQF
ncbi:MAG: MBOAT family O-acyltransferase [Bacteroidota bacterium]